MSSITTLISTALPSPTSTPGAADTAATAAAAAVSATTRMALIMAVMVSSICLAAFLWQCIQCYSHFRRFNWSQLMVLLICECLMGWAFSALSLLEYLFSISCQFRAVAELITINTGDVLLQVMLLHRMYAIKRSKLLLFSGMALIVLLLGYVMITLAAGQLVSKALDPAICATTCRAWVFYSKAILDLVFYLAAYIMFAIQAYMQKRRLQLGFKQCLLHNGVLYCLLASGYGTLVAIISFINAFVPLLSIVHLFAWCVMSYFVLKHLCIIFSNKYQSLLPLPTGNSSVQLHQFNKESTVDDARFNLSRLVELPAPDRRDSGMIRY